MSDELFEKIVQDLKQIPSDIDYAISPFKVNEPLLDPKIFPRMTQLATELPNAYFWFTSNFNLATPSMLEQLSETPRLGYIWVSLNSLREDEYHQWMGLSLPKTIQNIKRLLQLNREKRFAPNIVLGRVKDGTPNDYRFILDVQALFADFELDTDYQIRYATRGQWMGFLETHEPPIPRWPCSRWFDLSITCTGEVAFCCMDGHCKQSLGNVNQQSVLEVYNNPAYLKLRQNKTPRGKIKGECHSCTYL
jgi:radical SAM protein with 4Fe4S-binding SPASM domain